MSDVSGLRYLLKRSTAPPWSAASGGKWIAVSEVSREYVYPESANLALILGAVNALPALLDASAFVDKVIAAKHHPDYRAGFEALLDELIAEAEALK